MPSSRNVIVPLASTVKFFDIFGAGRGPLIEEESLQNQQEKEYGNAD
jgi:hypothetical protein